MFYKKIVPYSPKWCFRYQYQQLKLGPAQKKIVPFGTIDSPKSHLYDNYLPKKVVNIAKSTKEKTARRRLLFNCGLVRWGCRQNPGSSTGDTVAMLSVRVAVCGIFQVLSFAFRQSIASATPHRSFDNMERAPCAGCGC